MKFTLTIDSDNAALHDDPVHELSRICKKVLFRITNGATEGKCIDSNGNTVGSWTCEAGEVEEVEKVEEDEINEDQDEAENLAQNVEHLYAYSEGGTAADLEDEFRGYLIEHPASDNPDPNNVDFDALLAFLQE